MREKRGEKEQSRDTAIAIDGGVINLEAVATCARGLVRNGPGTVEISGLGVCVRITGPTLWKEAGWESV